MNKFGYTKTECDFLHKKIEEKTFPGARELFYSYNNISPLDFCVCFSILLPRIRTYRGGYFHAWASDDNTIDKWFAKDLSVADVERVVNHVHVWDLFKKGDGDRDWELDVLCEVTIQRAWEDWLPRIVGQTVRVEVDHSENEYGPTVTFYVIRE